MLTIRNLITFFLAAVSIVTCCFSVGAYDGENPFHIIIPANTMTTLVGDPNPAAVGEKVGFKATVSSVELDFGTPTGTVTFVINGEEKSPVQLENGIAIFRTSKLSLGKNTVVAIYSGDSTFLTSTSPTIIEKVIDILPPKNLKVVQVIQNTCHCDSNLANVIAWKSPSKGQQPLLFRIFRDHELKRLAAEVDVVGSPSDQQRFTFFDPDRKNGKTYHYFIVSVDAKGNSSIPAKVVFRPKKK